MALAVETALGTIGRDSPAVKLHAVEAAINAVRGIAATVKHDKGVADREMQRLSAGVRLAAHLLAEATTRVLVWVAPMAFSIEGLAWHGTALNAYRPASAVALTYETSCSATSRCMTSVWLR